MAGDILRQARKLAQEAEIYSVSYEVAEASFEANRLKAMQTRQSRGWSLRLIKDGRLGFAATTRPDADADLLGMALESAPWGQEARFHLPSFNDHPAVEVYDPAGESVEAEAMAKLGQGLIDEVRQGWPDLQCEAQVTRSRAMVEIDNSEGGRACYQRSGFYISVEGMLVRGTDMLFVGDSQGSCQPILDTRDIVSSVREQLERARRTAPGLSGTYPVVFTPQGVASAFLFPLITALNGHRVLQGASPLGEKLGQRAFHPSLTLTDDATLPFRPASRPCDDEGVTSQRIPLIQEGVVANFLYDLQTAGLARVKTTASARRSLESPPFPATTNLVLASGDATFQEMVSDIEQGLVVDILMGAGQGNILGGEFSGNVLLGYRVERGEIVGRVKDTMVSGNIYEVLREVAAVGSQPRWVGSNLLPPLLCARVSLASK